MLPMPMVMDILIGEEAHEYAQDYGLKKVLEDIERFRQKILICGQSVTTLKN